LILYFILWILGFIFTLMKGKWVNFTVLSYFDLDLIAIFIAYFVLFYGQIAVGAFAFGQGLLIDVMSYGLYGCFTLLYLGVFWVVYLGCKLFDIREVKGQIIVISMAVFLKKLIFYFLLIIFSIKVEFSLSFALMSVISAIVTGFFAPFIFYLLNFLMGVNVKELAAFSK